MAEDLQLQRLGRHSVSTFGGEQVRAYVPARLPPVPPVNFDSLQVLLEQANPALGRLDGLASILPDLSLFIYAYVRKEAVLSVPCYAIHPGSRILLQCVKTLPR